MTNSPRRVVLDTSVAIATFRRDPDVLKRLEAIQSVLSVIVLGELYRGARKARLMMQEMSYIASLMVASDFIDVRDITAGFYADIVHDLESRGLMIPQNDVWIAANALEWGLPVATRDEHFKRVTGLTVEMW